MSLTATATTRVMTMATTTLSTDQPTTCCPGCGYNLPPDTSSQTQVSQAQARISELEAQVRLLNQKATAAVDRWADYEDEIARLRGQHPHQQQSAHQTQQQKNLAAAAEPASPSRASFLQNGTSRLSQLLSPRKSTPNLHDPNNNNVTGGGSGLTGLGIERPPGMPRAASDAANAAHAQQLIAALSREKSLRKEAEGRLTATSREVEELSVSLFEQANEMVASERRARAALEERVGELEKRDKEKGRRLERLEKAMSRIERVRALLKES